MCARARAAVASPSCLCLCHSVSVSARVRTCDWTTETEPQRYIIVLEYIIRKKEEELVKPVKYFQCQMAGGGMGSFWTCFALLAAASAGPLHRYPRESEDYQNDFSAYANYTANEVCFSEGEVFQKGDMMPNPGPCEECRCEPPSIVCNMIKCPVNNNGCRTIQRANHCCPDYNCECDYNGQLYNDGERLDLPEEPCQVCYCKGGEVMCNSITCYHRDDCDPIQVPGQCCPKYENCPVRDMGSSSSDDKNVLVRPPNKTNHVPPKREMNPWLLTKLPSASNSPPPKSSQESTTEGGAVIIVSDWLTERRTTTEDAARLYSSAVFTDEPEAVITTGLRQDIITKNPDTITPVDEVIFTRIDGLKVNKEKNLEEPTSISPIDTGKIVSENSASNTPDAPFSLTVVEVDTKQSDYPEKINVSETDVLGSTISILTQTDLPVKIREPGLHDTTIISTANPTFTDSLNTSPSIYDKNKTPTRHFPKDVILDNIYGIDGLSLGEFEEETTSNDFLGYQTTDSEDWTTGINELTVNTLEDQTKDEPRVGQVKISVDEDKTTLGDFVETTTNSVVDEEVTTPFYTEVNLEKDNLKHGFATELPVLMEDSSVEPTEMETFPAIDQEMDNTKENTSTPGIENSKAYPNEVKIKRNNPNETSNRNVQVNPLATPLPTKNSVSTVPATIQDSAVISEIISKSESLISNNTSTNVTLDQIVTTKSSADPIMVSSDDSADGLESPSDSPPILELNSHVPYLQLGGHEHTDTVEGTGKTTVSNNNYILLMDKDSISNLALNNSNGHRNLSGQTISPDSIPSVNISRVEDSKQSAIKKTEEINGENDRVEVETTTETMFSTSHIPLTPGDLKVIAEYLINNTIKTVPVNSESDYVPNPWLKGNLTSEEKMTSILSAANISVSFINKTDHKSKSHIDETITKPNVVTKYEKDKYILGNNALNDLKISNKTGFIKGKNDEYLGSPKISSEPETHLNNEAKDILETHKVTNTKSPNTIKISTDKNTTPNVNEDGPAKNQANSKKLVYKSYTESQLPTVGPTTEHNVSSVNNLRFENVNPVSSSESDQNTQKGLLRKDKMSDITTASSTTSPLQPSP